MLQGWLPDVAGPSSILSFELFKRFDQMIDSTSVHQRNKQIKVLSQVLLGPWVKVSCISSCIVFGREFVYTFRLLTANCSQFWNWVWWLCWIFKCWIHWLCWIFDGNGTTGAAGFNTSIKKVRAARVCGCFSHYWGKLHRIDLSEALWYPIKTPQSWHGTGTANKTFLTWFLFCCPRPTAFLSSGVLNQGWNVILASTTT